MFRRYSRKALEIPKFTVALLIFFLKMFPDYQDQVLSTYQKKRADGNLSFNLLHPTPARLREECLVVLRDRYLKKDDKVIKAFFELQQQEADYEMNIRRFDTDKLKPLVKFIRGETTTTEVKNIELLAWLIDYEPRPYRFDPQEVLAAENQPSVPPFTFVKAPELPETISAALPARQKSSFYKSSTFVWILLSAVGIGITGYWLWQEHYKGCAIWTGIQYQSTTCSQDEENTNVVVVDRERLNSFKLISRPDTLTSAAIGRVWYFKRNDSLEVYTAGGYHPLHSERRLKKLTAYMYNKYVPRKVYRNVNNN